MSITCQHGYYKDECSTCNPDLLTAVDLPFKPGNAPSNPPSKIVQLRDEPIDPDITNLIEVLARALDDSKELLDLYTQKYKDYKERRIEYQRETVTLIEQAIENLKEE